MLHRHHALTESWNLPKPIEDENQREPAAQRAEDSARAVH